MTLIIYEDADNKFNPITNAVWTWKTWLGAQNLDEYIIFVCAYTSHDTFCYKLCSSTWFYCSHYQIADIGV